MGLQRAGHDLATKQRHNICIFTFMLASAQQKINSITALKEGPISLYFQMPDNFSDKHM